MGHTEGAGITPEGHAIGAGFVPGGLRRVGLSKSLRYRRSKARLPSFHIPASTDSRDADLLAQFVHVLVALGGMTPNKQAQRNG